LLQWAGWELICFFVISGFLITDILLRTRTEPSYYSSFIWRRALRILPAYYLCLIIFPLIIASIPELLSKYAYFRKYEWIFWIQGQNWLFFATGNESNRFFFSHFWSLAIEEQYYLIWPFIILWVRHEQNLVRIIFLLIMFYIGSRALTWAYWGNSDKTHSFQFLTHGDGLCFGSLIAIWKRAKLPDVSRKLIITAVSFILLELILLISDQAGLISIPHFSILGYTVIAALFSLMVFYALQTGSFYTKILSIAPLRFLGKISFGVYLYHFPILFICEARLLPFLSKYIPVITASILLPFLVLLISLAVSIISYYFFESFFLRRKGLLFPASSAVRPGEH
jgi:peptidoglycan/LPS O-acetylase OafA/YrhL